MASLTEPEARRVALVTGAAVRIGRAIGLALGGAGMSVIVHYRRSEAEAAQLCEELASRGVHAWSVRGDFADPAEAERIVERAIAAAGVCRSRSASPSRSRRRSWSRSSRTASAS